MYLSSEAHVVIAAGFFHRQWPYAEHTAVCQNGLVKCGEVIDKGVVYNVVRFFEYYLEYLLKIHCLDCESPAFPWLRAKFNLRPILLALIPEVFGIVWIASPWREHFPHPLRHWHRNTLGARRLLEGKGEERLRYETDFHKRFGKCPTWSCSPFQMGPNGSKRLIFSGLLTTHQLGWSSKQVLVKRILMLLKFMDVFEIFSTMVSEGVTDWMDRSLDM